MKPRRISLVLAAVLVTALSVAGVTHISGREQATQAAPSVAPLAAPSVDDLRTYVEWLSAPAREGRRAGLMGAAESAEYVSRQFERIGFKTEIQEFGGGRRNVIARYGTEPRYILIGAHYDGQGKGNPSASDNAAGVAVTLEIARQLKAGNLPVSIVAVAFDDEEQGLNGSLYYVDHPPFPLENAMAALIFDTLGRPFIDLHSWTLFVLGAESSPELSSVVQKRGNSDMLVAGADLIGPRSDFAPFVRKKVPYLFFSHGTHVDYHGPGDTPERVDYARVAEDTKTVIEIARDIASMKTRPAFLDEPRYPLSEAAALQRVLNNLRQERPNLPPAYKLIFDDLQPRIQTGAPRESFHLAASAMLALATPRFSSFFLNFELGPYYALAKKPEIVTAIIEESRKWEGDAN